MIKKQTLWANEQTKGKLLDIHYNIQHINEIKQRQV